MSKKQRDNLIWGIILIVLGLLFLLDNLGFDAWRFLFKLWPLILIIWGAYKLYYGLKGHQEVKAEVIKDQNLDKKDES
ncbi:MAG TPA: DUF5668 domain-containing protein [Candidatus Saccharicenans sp.]|jgi:uncharacterized membrane protein|nr:DUF5668 domain-containing protein [Candidatus Saccharicenans sp.]HOJ26194.1 DUF5668 domain-containing protein [Candidatus Saccharicenans sp.]HOL45510.1 DUF5668 domain-containing protein [Candidatus Saccharicenans sp.]HOM94592.1 DUF5668 domain-containing protein [Candidatus Saccharicenans sp.]HOP60757.1 DUF5668 domain-containing protein [Candidatus Saccharicenans sp.]